MRDHLLGCRAFLPPEPDQDRTIHLRKRYPVGIPERAIRGQVVQMQEAYLAKKAVVEFEDGDHTPEHMRNDFPREYDLQTMLNEAAERFGYSAADLTLERNFSAFLAGYDAEMRRLCGL